MESLGGSSTNSSTFRPPVHPTILMVVIIGAGIAGAATAYYTCRNPTLLEGRRVVVVDAVGPAACASGTAGAYVSSHWGDGTKRQVLFRESFALHKEIAESLQTPFHCVSACRVDVKDPSVDGAPRTVEHGEASSCVIDGMSQKDMGQPWMKQVHSFHPIPGKSAIVDPQKLTKALVDDAVERGASLFINAVTGFDLDSADKIVSGIQFEDGTTLDVFDGEKVVIAIGPWSSRVEDWFNTPLPIDGVLSTSLTWNKTDSLPNLDSAIFCNEDSAGCHLEILPRFDGSLYVSGCGGSTVSSPRIFRCPEERPQPQESCLPNVARAHAAQKRLAALLGQSPGVPLPPPSTVQACLRPVSPDGIPIIGKLPSWRNVYVVTGGGPWGVTWGPLMGKCMANLLLCNDPSTSPLRLASYTPRRFDTLMYRTLSRQRKSPSTS